MSIASVGLIARGRRSPNGTDVNPASAGLDDAVLMALMATASPS